MLIMGLDISTETGVSFATDKDGEADILHHAEIQAPLKKGQTEVERWNDYMMKLAAVVELVQDTWGRIDRCFIEGYAFTPRQGKDSIVTQCAFGSSARMIIHEYQIPYCQVTPGNWKQFLTGAGNLKKDQVMMALYKHFGFEAKTNNIADATVIALFGLYASASISAPAYRIDAINKWRKSKFGETF